MNTAHPMDSEKPVRWYMSLRFVLFMLNLVLALVFGTLAFVVNQQQLERPLTSASQAVLQLQQDKLVEQVRAQTDNASHFNQALSAVAGSLWGLDQQLRTLGRNLLEQIPADSAIVAAGIWPEPRSFNPARERYSFYWTLQNGAVSFHGDYNNPANISYHGERWYTPLRYHQSPGCFWSGRYGEPFLKKQVVACATPVMLQGRFVGVTTLVLDPSRIQASVMSRDDADPFYLLVDPQQRVLRGQGVELSDKDSLPKLAQREQRFGPVSVHLHQKADALIKTAQAADEQWQSKLDTLVKASRDLPKLEAALMLARAQQGAQPGSGENLLLKDDTLAQTSLYLQDLGGVGVLISGQYQPPKIAGLSMNFWVSAATTAGAIALALLLSGLFGSHTAVTPLRRLIAQLRQPAEDTLLDEAPANEIGTLAGLFNVRHERIRDLLESNRRPSFTPRAITPATASHSTPDKETDSGWAVVDALNDSVIMTDSQGHIQYLNSAAETLCGKNLAQAQSLSFDEVFHILDRHGKTRIANLAARAIKAGRRSERPLQAVYRTRSGHNLPVAVSSAPIQGAHGETNGAVMILHDNRQTAVDSGGSDALSLRDKLTGLFNREAFDAELASRVESTRMGAESAFSLLYLDVDHMQDINDAFGNDGGDEFLRQLSRLIQSDVGDSNPVYRLHGDKFGVLLATEDAAEAQVAAELLRADVQSWGFQWKGEKRDVSLSASLVRVNKDSGRAVDIMRLADELCQQAKNEGRGRIVTAQAQATKHARRDDKGWLSAIKQGLSQDRFHLSTQQIRALQRKADEGQIFDTLMLLEDQEGFWTDSDTFMPVAERHGMAQQLDRWTLEHVFKRLSEDKSLVDQLDFCLVSLSASSIAAPDFLDFMFEHFKDGYVAPHKICLDLNENYVHSRISTAREFCQTMSRAGCRLSLSNVSTRPSSYKLIQELPLQLVRFDPLLTRRADSDPVDRLATESLHRIVHTLGRQSMAVQVDNPELLRILQGIGVHYAQGNAVARPNPILFHAQS